MLKDTCLFFLTSSLKTKDSCLGTDGRIYISPFGWSPNLPLSMLADPLGMLRSSLAGPALVTLKSLCLCSYADKPMVPVPAYTSSLSQTFISIICVGITFVALCNELNKELAKAKTFFFQLHSFFCPRVVHGYFSCSGTRNNFPRAPERVMMRQE